MQRGLAILIGLILLFGISVGNASDKDDEMNSKAEVLLKALNHNEAIKDRIKEQCVIAVLYNPDSPQSVNEKEMAVNSLDKNKKIKIFDKKIRIMELPMTPSTNLEKRIIINGINAYVLTSGLERYLKPIRESAKYNLVTTLSLNPELINQSYAALGAQKDDTGYKLLVNMSEAQNIHVKLGDDILTTAMVVGK